MELKTYECIRLYVYCMYDCGCIFVLVALHNVSTKTALMQQQIIMKTAAANAASAAAIATPHPV